MGVIKMRPLCLKCIKEIFFKYDSKGVASFDWLSFQLVECPNCPYLNKAVKEVLEEMGVCFEEETPKQTPHNSEKPV